MKISYNWLKTYLPVNLTPERAAEILTQTGLEVEGVTKTESVPGGLNGVVIGEVIEKWQHPNADRLSVTKVEIGGEAPLQIVCGAPNVDVGQKVVVATVGCQLHPSGGEPFKIKKGKIRGEESLGMICAEDEIGLGASHDGIMVLEESAKVGTPAGDFFELEDDYTIEIGLTPNRTDGMSHIGVARDLRAALRNMYDVEEADPGEVLWPSVDAFKEGDGSFEVPVEVRNEERCRRYAGVSITGVEVKASPDWLQERLRSIGLAPINNVVDITNFVLHETGQPLHAFDAANISGGKVVVDTLPSGTGFITLDEVERKLTDEDLMICDSAGNGLCIAGVFGGIHSGVTESTSKVFLESACFDPVSVRKTAKRHGMNTDASFRFERGVDPNGTLYALKRAAMLICELAGGEVSSSVFDHYPNPVEEIEIEVDCNQMYSQMGLVIPRESVTNILVDLDFKIDFDGDTSITVKTPTYRVDVTRPADVLEEVLRIYGYNNIPFPEKLNASLSHAVKPDFEDLQHRISEALVSRGFTEIMSNSLTKSDYIQGYAEAELAENKQVLMLNPLSQDLNALRQSLLFGGLEAVARNQNHFNPDLNFFEFGKVYNKKEEGYSESRRLCLFMTGRRAPESWNTSDEMISFIDLKKSIEFLMERSGLMGSMRSEPLSNEMWGEGMTLRIGKDEIVRFGSVPGAALKQQGIKAPVYWADIDWDAMVTHLSRRKVKAKDLPKFPAVRRDLSLLIDTQVNFAQLAAAARKSEKKLLKQVDLFDVFEDASKLPENKKSYALMFVLQDEQKTLTDKQIEKAMSGIQRALETECGAQLR